MRNQWCIKEYNNHDYLTYYRNSSGDEAWYDYDNHDHLIHYKTSYGIE